MTTTTAPPQDDRLRELLASADPALGHGSQTPEHLWSRIADDIAVQAVPLTAAAAEEGVLADATASPSRAPGPRRSFARRHWQGGLLVAAGVATLAIAAGTVLPGFSAGGGDGSSATAQAPTATSDGGQSAVDTQGGADAAAGRSATLEDGSGGSAASDSVGSAATPAADPTLVRSGSLIVGTDDVHAGRDSFVTQIEGMGGRLVSETVTSRGDTGSSDITALKEQAAGDYAASYPYPYPSGPGIWLTVKVPVASYDQAMAAARATGEVVQLQQSSYDVGSQITDVRTRIVVLTASLKRLEGLMDQANGVSDVIRLEKAIADRQAELDSLLGQQRDLSDQTEMSQISLTLMSPEDAKGTVDPQPQLTWWESFVQGLGQFWSWLGQALLIVSPLLIAAGVLWWVRRRRMHGGGTPQADGGAVPDGS